MLLFQLSWAKMSKAREVAKLGEVLTNGQIGGRRNIIINGAIGCLSKKRSKLVLVPLLLLTKFKG